MADKIDIIKIDIPLLMRILEYVREDVKDDVSLHNITQEMIKASKTTGILTMKNYDDIIDTNINEYKQYFNLEEAELINKMTDYRGGVVYKLRDPDLYKRVVKTVSEFVKKKKIYMTTAKRLSPTIGYFYFRVGENFGRESQIIQGYLSQMVEIEKFKFKVLSSKKRKRK